MQHEKELLQNIHVGLTCYRKGFMHCVTSIANWLAEVVEAHAVGHPPDLVAMEAVYSILGLKDDQLELLMEAQLVWDPQLQRLLVDADFLHRADSIEMLSGLLLELWRFPAFSSSRWVTMGCSARKFAVATMTGFPHLFQVIRDQGRLSDYEVAGVSKLNDPELQWCVTVGLISKVPDAFLCGVLEDSRLARNRHAIALSMQVELESLEALPHSAWCVLARHFRTTAQLLRHHVLQGVHIAIAYLEWKVFAVLAGHPWSLVAETPAAACDALLQMDVPPEEDTAHKAWALMQLGHPRADMERAFALLQNVSWTSAFTEKQHASTAVVKKYHSELSYEVTSARAFMHTFRPAQGHMQVNT